MNSHQTSGEKKDYASQWNPGSIAVAQNVHGAASFKFSLMTAQDKARNFLKNAKLAEEPRKYLEKFLRESKIVLDLLERVIQNKEDLPSEKAAKVLSLIQCFNKHDVQGFFERQNEAQHLQILSSQHPPHPKRKRSLPPTGSVAKKEQKMLDAFWEVFVPQATSGLTGIATIPGVTKDTLVLLESEKEEELGKNARFLSISESGSVRFTLNPQYRSSGEGHDPTGPFARMVADVKEGADQGLYEAPDAINIDCRMRPAMTATWRINSRGRAQAFHPPVQASKEEYPLDGEVVPPYVSSGWFGRDAHHPLYPQWFNSERQSWVAPKLATLYLKNEGQRFTGLGERYITAYWKPQDVVEALGYREKYDLVAIGVYYHYLYSNEISIHDRTRQPGVVSVDAIRSCKEQAAQDGLCLGTPGITSIGTADQIVVDEDCLQVRTFADIQKPEKEKKEKEDESSFVVSKTGSIVQDMSLTKRPKEITVGHHAGVFLIGSFSLFAKKRPEVAAADALKAVTPTPGLT